MIMTLVYKVEDGYIGVTGVLELKSEMMDFSDCGNHCVAKEYEPVQSIIYVPKTK